VFALVELQEDSGPVDDSSVARAGSGDLLEGVAVGVGEFDWVFFASDCACFHAFRLTRDLHCGDALAVRDTARFTGRVITSPLRGLKRVREFNHRQNQAAVTQAEKRKQEAKTNAHRKAGAEQQARIETLMIAQLRASNPEAADRFEATEKAKTASQESLGNVLGFFILVGIGLWMIAAMLQGIANWASAHPVQVLFLTTCAIGLTACTYGKHRGWYEGWFSEPTPTTEHPTDPPQSNPQ
jgi:hypothetical protein